MQRLPWVGVWCGRGGAEALGLVSWMCWRNIQGSCTRSGCRRGDRAREVRRGFEGSREGAELKEALSQ